MFFMGFLRNYYRVLLFFGRISIPASTKFGRFGLVMGASNKGITEQFVRVFCFE